MKIKKNEPKPQEVTFKITATEHELKEISYALYSLFSISGNYQDRKFWMGIHQSIHQAVYPDREYTYELQ